MLKTKKVLAGFLSLILLLALFTGCTGKVAEEPSITPTAEPTAQPTAEPANDKEDINISMTWWGDTKRNEVYNKVIDLFEEANPNIKVERPFGTWAEYFDKLSTQIAGGNAPDVIGMHQRYVSEYALRGALYDLQPLVDSGALDVSDIPDSILKSGYVGDKLYMISQGVTGTGTAYNTSTFDQLGVSYPSMDWTWDEFSQKVNEIKAAADTKGMDLWASSDFSIDIYNFTYWARSHGEHLFTSEGDLGFSEETAVSWFKLWKDYRDQGFIPDAATVSEYDSLPLEQSLFATNKIAITGMPASQIGLFQQQVTDDGVVTICRMPHVEGQPDPEYLSGGFFTVNAKSENPEAAGMLISFFINNTEGQKTFKLEQGVPATTTAIDAIKDTLSESEMKSLDFIQNQLVKYSSYEPYPPTGYNEISVNFKTIAMSVAFGEQTPEEAAAQLMKDSNEVLSR